MLVCSVADPGCLSRIRLFPIQNPGSEFFHPGSASKNLSILTQKWFLSSRKYNPGCSSRIPYPDPQHWCCGSEMFIPDPNFSISRIQGHKNSGSWNRIRIKELRTIKTVSKLGKMSWDVHPGSRIPDPGVKKASDPASPIWIRNTDPNYHTKLTIGENLDEKF